MKIVYKYVLDNDNNQSIMVAAGAKFLHADNQNDKIAVWFEEDTVNEPAKEVRRFELYMTGEAFPDPAGQRYHRGTVLLHNGSFVVHIYEVLS